MLQATLMRTAKLLLIATSFVTVPSLSAGAASFYDNLADWQAAVGPHQVEDF